MYFLQYVNHPLLYTAVLYVFTKHSYAWPEKETWAQGEYRRLYLTKIFIYIIFLKILFWKVAFNSSFLTSVLFFILTLNASLIARFYSIAHYQNQYSKNINVALWGEISTSFQPAKSITQQNTILHTHFNQSTFHFLNLSQLDVELNRCFSRQVSAWKKNRGKSLQIKQ